MDNKKRIHELADMLNQQNRDIFSTSELSIITQSQYYNIVDLYNHLIGDKGIYNIEYVEEIKHLITISSKIISISEAFLRNIEKFPKEFSWEGKDKQTIKVNEIIEDVKLIKIQLEEFLLENS